MRDYVPFVIRGQVTRPEKLTKKKKASLDFFTEILFFVCLIFHTHLHSVAEIVVGYRNIVDGLQSGSQLLYV